ncbi:MAG: biopolymer transporter ExbD [Bacteroidales bacterium]|nr:biopolymer transporter ExbD [Lentimicrobiaceae bacterium]MBQ2852655.1 biopolymer transporter ExbD [Bacteroidales bacterium]MBR7176176.1 biopolymer transporter ExbD [Bacteroidales bacterium]
MAIRTRNKRKIDFNSSSMSDLVFLLLIFFMLTSTLVAPNAIKLLLPSSKSKTMSKQTVTVYVDERNQYYVGEEAVVEDNLQEKIYNALGNETEGTVVIRSDKSVAVQYIVNIIDAVNEINKETDNKHKVLLATSNKK